MAVEFETEIRVGLAESHLRLGNFEKAVQTAEQTLDLSRQRNNRLTECKALMVCGEAFKVGDAHSISRAKASFEQAQRLITQTGATIFERELLLARAA